MRKLEFFAIFAASILFCTVFGLMTSAWILPVVGLFLISYGVLRVVTELWRLPDADLAVQRILGLSRGQWLSVVMVLAGIVGLLVIRLRGSPELFGGWGRGRAPLEH